LAALPGGHSDETPSLGPQHLIYGHWLQHAPQSPGQAAQRWLLVRRMLKRPGARLLARLQQDHSAAAAAAMGMLFDELQSITANAGSSDAERAANHLLHTSLDPYRLCFDELWNSSAQGTNPSGYQLLGLRSETQRGGNRPQIKLIFDFSGINTLAPTSWYYRVDTGGLFPFLVGGSRARRHLSAQLHGPARQSPTS